MNHIHKCKDHGNCVVIVDLERRIKTHVENVSNIDSSCPYYGLHLSDSFGDPCSQKKQGL